MKFFSILILVCAYLPNLYAAPLSNIVKCLAVEEELHHKNKYMGPEYYLNQQILNYLAIENQLKFSTQFEESVCSTPNKSWLFMKNILLDEQGSILPLPKGVTDQELTSYAKSIEQLISKTYSIFMSHITMIQRDLGHPHCLQHYVDGYDEFLEREKYLKENESQYQNPNSLSVIKNLMEVTANPKQLKERCQALSKEKARL